MWEDVHSGHHPGPAVPRLHRPRVSELQVAAGPQRGQENDLGGGAEVVLERLQDGGERQEGDGAGDGAARTERACRPAAGACQPVHRGLSTLKG